MNDLKPKKIFRSFALPISTFDYLKDFQRSYQQRNKVLITNNQALTILLDEHKQFNEECEYTIEIKPATPALS